MNNTKFYLRQEIAIEPLVYSWYAHPFMLPPAAVAMFIRDKVKLMKSYLVAPELHEMAMKSPDMAGSMFLNMPAARANEVAALLESTLAENEDRITFAEDVIWLYRFLLREAKGYSLESLYRQVPQRLKGFVELLYDVNNQPSFRFFETLLYNSKWNSTAGQSLLFLEMPDGSRGYISDTPRIRQAGEYELEIPFRDKRIDEIARLRVVPQSYDTICSYFPEDMRPYFDKLFTASATQQDPSANYSGEDVRVRYFGHACVLIQTKDVSILIDAFINYSSKQSETNYTFQDLPDVIDYVLITHSHGDHIIPEYLLQIRYKIRHMVVPRNGNGNLEDPSLKLLLKSIGFEHVLELDELDEISIPDGQIIGMPFLGEHCDLTIKSKILHLVKLKGRSFMFASDSSNLEIEVYRIAKSVVGDVDVLFLGMESEGAPLSLNYGALMPEELNRKMDQSRRVNGSDFESGYAIVREFNPAAVYIYAMGLEPWTHYILGIQYTEESVQLMEANKLISKCLEEGIHAELLKYKKELIFTSNVTAELQL